MQTYVDQGSPRQKKTLEAFSTLASNDPPKKPDHLRRRQHPQNMSNRIGVNTLFRRQPNHLGVVAEAHTAHKQTRAKEHLGLEQIPCSEGQEKSKRIGVTFVLGIAQSWAQAYMSNRVGVNVFWSVLVFLSECCPVSIFADDACNSNKGVQDSRK